jgi:hypothetical protein
VSKHRDDIVADEIPVVPSDEGDRIEAEVSLQPASFFLQLKLSSSTISLNVAHSDLPQLDVILAAIPGLANNALQQLHQSQQQIDDLDEGVVSGG